jgi:WD40 repeat protein
MVLLSGGADSDVIIWDLLTLTGKLSSNIYNPLRVMCVGKCKLRGHKDMITGCCLLSTDNDATNTPRYIVTCSKDTLVKVFFLK